MVNSFLIDCMINGKNIRQRRSFITTDCSKMCVCYKTALRQTVTCLPLCPERKSLSCPPTERSVQVQKLYTFKPSCFCPMFICSPTVQQFFNRFRTTILRIFTIIKVVSSILVPLCISRDLEKYFPEKMRGKRDCVSSD